MEINTSEFSRYLKKLTSITPKHFYKILTEIDVDLNNYVSDSALINETTREGIWSNAELLELMPLLIHLDMRTIGKVPYNTNEPVYYIFHDVEQVSIFNRKTGERFVVFIKRNSKMSIDELYKYIYDDIPTEEIRKLEGKSHKNNIQNDLNDMSFDVSDTDETDTDETDTDETDD